ncbi:MAG: carbamoyltransferase family protein [bacterium]
MYILGISAFGHDASAALIKDGELICATEEERFTRKKYYDGFPTNAINYCLKRAGIEINDVDHIGYYMNYWLYLGWFLRESILNFFEFWGFYAREPLRLINDLLYRINLPILRGFQIRDILGYKNKIHMISHHMAHAASAFLVSPFEEAAILTIDSIGEWPTTAIGIGRRNRIKFYRTIKYPNSLGTLYRAFTIHLGFGEMEAGKVMGLAPYGDPGPYYNLFEKMVKLTPDGGFSINSDFLLHRYPARHWSRKPEDFSREFFEIFGPTRNGQPLRKSHEDIAASLQLRLEETILHMVKYLYEKAKCRNLCIAGGVGLNSVANGRILNETPFEELFIQPAAGDGGTSLGCAYYIYNILLGYPRNYVFNSAYLGAEYTEEEIVAVLRASGNGLKYRRIEEIERLTARFLAEGKIVGWFQGRAELGPRALGNRSILADPRRAEMKDILNEKVKHREPFRPFAPSVLEDKCGEYFENDYPSPYMLLVYKVRPEKRSVIPAVTHVDGTGRVQTVNEKQNPKYWRLIKAFEEITGVPIILNTSFNVKGEPIVNSPQDAINCFKSTQMDLLVLGDYLVEKVKT